MAEQSALSPYQACQNVYAWALYDATLYALMAPPGSGSPIRIPLAHSVATGEYVGRVVFPALAPGVGDLYVRGSGR